MVAELRSLGVPQEQFAAAAAAEQAARGKEPGVEVWPSNWLSLRVFLAVETQWRIVMGFGVSAYLGLDYPGV